ncbi:hypothetical protein B5F77_13035 [Parabacteroides sp. An277]|uniref:helix-turn-helix transcriptional regulator n=1 Tax=Parabacteroides sp. An277 TaxID=1965619 RepID=UPI000B38E5B9|nr:WYL domain-containing protein [Parabacteroides sp. An277]OUO50352.1 hypothetical protein B5F77_13035 [Parabacteroides sp. An277]
MQKWERCLWIISVFNEYGDFSLKELNERFMRYSLNYDGEEISERTFNRDREFIASSFQIDIEYDARIRKYTFRNKEVIKENPIYRYLLSSFHIQNLSSLVIKHKSKIMLQDPPTGVELLHTVLNAIDQGRTLYFDYTSYYTKDRTYHFELIPAFVRLFEQRWYLIGEFTDRSQTRVLALERMQHLTIGEKELLPSPTLTPQSFYEGCYGIIRDDKQPQTIWLKVYNKQVDYIRSLPLHDSQKEIETGKDYAIFQYYFRPSYDFIQQILWNRENIEVLKPVSLREEIISLLTQMLERYK